jgi:hypothetical protein
MLPAALGALASGAGGLPGLLGGSNETNVNTSQNVTSTSSISSAISNILGSGQAGSSGEVKASPVATQSTNANETPYSYGMGGGLFSSSLGESTANYNGNMGLIAAGVVAVAGFGALLIWRNR